MSRPPVFSFPRLTKLPPTPAWSLLAAPAHPADRGAAPLPRALGDAGLTAEPAPWGTCEIVLVADRQLGATHKFFHDWRFEAVLRRGEPEPGTILAARPIAPARRRTVAAPGAPAAVALQFRAGTDPTGPRREAFTWTPPLAADAVSTDPLVMAWTHLRQQLRAAGWQPQAAASLRYHKPGPVGLAAGDAKGPEPAPADRGAAMMGGPHGSV